MKSKRKKLSNSFSTGGGGSHFEAHVQASFVVLMLTGGCAPCLPPWPITKIKLQGKIDGFDTDDLIVFVEKSNKCKLLGQIKHSLKITNSSEEFAEVMQAAWDDFNNPNVFSRGKDKIALITGSLNKTDTDSVQWLLNHAKHTNDVDEFFRHVKQTNFSSATTRKKLAVIQHHLRAANNRVDVTRDELYSFLQHFHLLGYDLGQEVGVVLSLLHSHISQFHQQYPQGVWSRIVDVVQTWNQDSGTITPDKLPEDLIEAFEQRRVIEIPKELITAKPATEEMDWSRNSHATDLALVNLLGAWDENNESDIAVLERLLGEDYGLGE